jgi:hypothetical protein
MAKKGIYYGICAMHLAVLATLSSRLLGGARGSPHERWAGAVHVADEVGLRSRHH